MDIYLIRARSVVVYGSRNGAVVDIFAKSVIGVLKMKITVMKRRNNIMRCPKCGKNVYSHHQEIDETKTKITRYYGCRNCHHKFRTIERIIEESEEN